MTETSIVHEIESLLSRLCRIWMAEYLHAGAFDERLNRALFGTLSAPNPIPTGQWIALARRIRQSFEERSMPTVVDGLRNQDFGELGDRKHLISRLVDFRNTFSHGGLDTPPEEERTHRALLNAIMERVPALRDQPILFQTEDGRTLVADTGQPYPVPVSSIAVPPFPQPFIVGRDGRTVLHLHPLLHMTADAQLMPADSKRRTYAITVLFERYALGALVERYQKEKKGHLDFGEVVRGRVTHPVPKVVLDEVKRSLSTGHTLILVETYPGCGKAGVLVHLHDSAVSDGSPPACLWLVEPEDIGQSGITFANYILRQVEQILCLADESLGLAKAEAWEVSLDRAKQALTQAGKRMLLGIEDLHAGCRPVGNEPVSVMGVYRSLAGGPIAAVATTHPFRIPGRPVCDQLVRFPYPADADISLDRLELAVSELCPNTHPMRLRVMRELVRRSQPATLFALCDALETDGNRVFEPEVERALWDLRPLLRMTVISDEKAWAPFTPALSQVRTIGGN